MKTGKIIIDGTHAPLGRLASYAAKQLLLGGEVIIVNCSKVLISGRRENIIGDYLQTRARGSYSQRGPHFPKNPERLVKRTVRGMLPYKQGRGAQAFKHLRCYNETPAEFQEAKKITLSKEFKIKTMTLHELSKVI